MHYSVEISWEKDPNELFTDMKYHRKHKWLLDCGIELSASSSPQVVPIPMSDEKTIDPEEAFVAALSSCHMLFFLSIAAAEEYIVESYIDCAAGTMGNNEEGKKYMKQVILNPVAIFAGERKPSAEKIKKIHEVSHDRCYIANSIKTEIKINIKQGEQI